MKTVFIYTLEHPLTEEIRYVGKTRNPKMRFHNHCNKLHNEKTHKRNWINKLKSQNLKPVMSIIDEVLEEEWKFWERYWIIQLKAWGFNLVNHTSGGDGLTMGNSTSFKKGMIPKNKGKGIVLKNCKNCNIEFPSHEYSKRVFCSKDCSSKYLSKFLNSGSLKKGHKTWNKNKSGYKLGGRRVSCAVLQYDLNNNFIKEYLGYKEASIEVGCIPENIRRCCVGLSKSARKFIWKYKIKN